MDEGLAFFELKEEVEDFYSFRTSRTGPQLSGPRPGQRCYPGRTDYMLPFLAAWTCETRLPSEAGIIELWDTIVSGTNGASIDTVCSFLP